MVIIKFGVLDRYEFLCVVVTCDGGGRVLYIFCIRYIYCVISVVTVVAT